MKKLEELTQKIKELKKFEERENSLKAEKKQIYKEIKTLKGGTYFFIERVQATAAFLLLGAVIISFFNGSGDKELSLIVFLVAVLGCIIDIISSIYAYYLEINFLDDLARRKKLREVLVAAVSLVVVTYIFAF